MLLGDIDLGHDIVAPAIVLIVGVVATVAIGALLRFNRRAMHVIRSVEGQWRANGKSVKAGTIEQTPRDVLDQTRLDLASLKQDVAELKEGLAENTNETRATRSGLEDHVINDERQFREAQIERVKLAAVMEDRGRLVSDALQAILASQSKELGP
jgi:hypothetical protein